MIENAGDNNISERFRLVRAKSPRDLLNSFWTEGRLCVDVDHLVDVLLHLSMNPRMLSRHRHRMAELRLAAPELSEYLAYLLRLYSAPEHRV